MPARHKGPLLPVKAQVLRKGSANRFAGAAEPPFLRAVRPSCGSRGPGGSGLPLLFLGGSLLPPLEDRQPSGPELLDFASDTASMAHTPPEQLRGGDEATSHR